MILPILVLAGWYGCTTDFPGDSTILFYNTASLKPLYCRALKKAEKSIHVATYGLHDPDIKAWLKAKRANGVAVHILHDGKKTQKSGLDHAKILVIDDELSLIGSANLTTTSLQMHQNCVMAIRSKSVAEFLSHGSGVMKEGFLQLWKLPEPSALDHLISRLDQAQHSIHVAMFTFTHPKLIEALQRAHERNVDVKIVLNHSTARLPDILLIRKGRQMGLMHHKWALIDNQILICGSANWTKAAFEKNREVLAELILSNNQIKFCKKLWRDLWSS